MKVIQEKICFTDLPEYIRDQLAREIIDDFDYGYNDDYFAGVFVDLFEYDCSLKNDQETLKSLISKEYSFEKLINDDSFEYINKDIDILINQPILIFGGSISDGNHRTAVALSGNFIIRAYCY